MARNFLSFPSAPYQGTLSSKAFNNGKGSQKGLIVGFNIQWASYKVNGALLGAANPNFVVSGNLNAAGPNTVSGTWTVESVYIDNENVNFPVYVFFPSTGFAISCPQNSAGWYQVFTLDRVALIAGIGIPDSDIANNIATNVFFTDAFMVPYLDQELPTSIGLGLSSPSISRGNLPTPGYAPFPIGDQVTSSAVSLTAAGANSPLFTAIANTFIYISFLEMRLYGATGSTNGSLELFDSTTSQVVVTGNFFAPASATEPAPQILMFHNSAIKLNGAHNYALLNGPAMTAGRGEILAVFTQGNL